LRVATGIGSAELIGRDAELAAITALAELATGLTEAGDTNLAYRWLMAAAVRVRSADPEPSLDPVLAELARPVHLAGPGDEVSAVVDAARRDGKLATLPRLLTQLGWSAIAAADWKPALAAADEATRLATETGQPQWQAAAMTGQAMIAGLRGEPEAARQLTGQAEAIALPARASAVLGGIQLARGVTAIGAGRYDEAFDQLRRVFDRADPCCHPGQSSWALGDLAEAAARTGRTADARQIVAAFRPGPGDRVAPWTRVALVYADPLLTDGDDAGPKFAAALAADLTGWPWYRARLLLEYGAWLRRRRRVAEGRPPLRTARQICEAYGLRPWAERARQELRATGEPGCQPPAEQLAGLSPQELRIALLAAEGLSNRDIGQRLYLSPRTIGSHLYRMFPKLGISSRTQLRSVLGPADGSPATRSGSGHRR